MLTSRSHSCFFSPRGRCGSALGSPGHVCPADYSPSTVLLLPPNFATSLPWLPGIQVVLKARRKLQLGFEVSRVLAFSRELAEGHASPASALATPLLGSFTQSSCSFLTVFSLAVCFSPTSERVLLPRHFDFSAAKRTSSHKNILGRNTSSDKFMRSNDGSLSTVLARSSTCPVMNTLSRHIKAPCKHCISIEPQKHRSKNETCRHF